MNFESDFLDIIKSQLNTDNISYRKDGDASYFAARHCEIQIRKIAPVPRRVHFSNQIHNSLGKLSGEVNAEQKEKALEAWRSVFYIRYFLEKGQDVTQFLSKSINGSEKKDGLLWDFGMHHFHLSTQLEESGFVKRSDYLLFAIIADTDAYFLDIRSHLDPEELLWIRQDLLQILHSNWPELIKPLLLKGESETTLTDREKKELRRKNVNHCPQFEGHLTRPIGGGMMSDGSSALCRIWGDKLIYEIEKHQLYFERQPVEVQHELEEKGIKTSDPMEFKLVASNNLNLSAELVDALKKEKCLSKYLFQMGFIIVEASTKSPVVVSIEDQQKTL